MRRRRHSRCPAASSQPSQPTLNRSESHVYIKIMNEAAGRLASIQHAAFKAARTNTSQPLSMGTCAGFGSRTASAGTASPIGGCIGAAAVWLSIGRTRCYYRALCMPPATKLKRFARSLLALGTLAQPAASRLLVAPVSRQWRANGVLYLAFCDVRQACRLAQSWLAPASKALQCVTERLALKKYHLHCPPCMIIV